MWFDWSTSVFSVMKHGNDVSDMIGYLQVSRNFTFMKE